MPARSRSQNSHPLSNWYSFRLWRTPLTVAAVWLGTAGGAAGQATTRGRTFPTCDIAEADTSCCNCQNVQLQWSQRTNPAGIAQQGVWYKDCFWRCGEVCRVGTTLEFRLGNGVAPGPVLDLDCEAAAPGQPFNRRVKGQKDGIWLTPDRRLRVVTAATFYEKGEKLKQVLFWPNGLPRQVTLYRDGKRRKTGFHRYDEQGNPSRL